VRRALLLLALLAAGCGDVQEVRERDLAVRGGPPASAAGAPRAGGEGSAVRIAVVTHGQASSAFWAVVRNGIDAAQRQTGVTVTYRAPDVYSVSRMAELIDDAIAGRPEGLVVSIPERGLEAPIRRAVAAGIPVVSINAGSGVSRRLGALAHVGQPEERGGEAAGRRFAAAGVRRAVCFGRGDGGATPALTCRGLARALRRAGGTARVVAVDVRDPAVAQRRLRAAVANGRADGVLALDDLGARLALAAVPDRRVRLAALELSPDVLEAVRDGRIAFAVDQQAYLQGYLPIVLLAQRARYGLFPVRGALVPTGPTLVTRDNVAAVIAQSRRGIR
jgi:simple sugar transport system substrate-binding protein